MTTMPRNILRHAMRLVPALAMATVLTAQVPAVDPSARLREVLPADVAERVLARIAEARSRELPAAALENRALKFTARGVPPAEVERAVFEHAARMENASKAMRDARPIRPSDAEIEAGAEAMRQGVDGAAVSTLAKSAPSGRSLAVPLFVIGSLVERGLPSDEALSRVRERLVARATDAEIERMPGTVGGGRPAVTGQEMAGTRRPATVGGPPAGVPANGGAGAAPTKRPVTPPAGGGKRP